MNIQLTIKTAVAQKVAEKLTAFFPIPEVLIDPEDPANAGQLWNDEGTVKISAG